MDTIGTEESVLIREVSLFQGSNYVLELHWRKEKVSLFQGCPEGFHCIIYLVRVVETGKDESDKVFVHELIVCLSPHVDVTWPHSDVRVTVVPSQDLRSVSPRIKKRGGGGD